MPEIIDPILGRLIWSEDQRAWQATIVSGDSTIEFLIAGTQEPSPQLIAHARDIVHTLGDFIRMVEEFLEQQAHLASQQKGWLFGNGVAELAASEIRHLTIETVSLPWPDRSEDGMIYFKGPADETRSWRCDYVGRIPTGLGCDT